MLDAITDIIGRNHNDETCHPFKYQRGPKAGRFVYTLYDNDEFESADEDGLRSLIESGAFNKRGRIRMIPKGSCTTSGASALSVISYKGKPLS